QRHLRPLQPRSKLTATRSLVTSLPGEPMDAISTLRILTPPSCLTLTMLLLIFAGTVHMEILTQLALTLKPGHAKMKLVKPSTCQTVQLCQAIRGLTHKNHFQETHGISPFAAI